MIEEIEIENKILPVLKEYRRIILELNKSIDERNTEATNFLMEDANALQSIIFELLDENEREDGKNS